MREIPDAFLNLFPTSTTVLPGGELAVAGLSMRALAAQYGTPLYIYDSATLEAQVSRLRQLLDQYYPGQAAVAYAAKVYFSTRFARHLSNLGLDLDVVSLGEMQAARRAGFRAASIHLHGNNKTVEELNTALERNLHAIVADSLEEIDLLEELARPSGQPAPVWLRITPDLDVQTHPHIATGSAESKFGLHIANGQAREALRRLKESQTLGLTGLHFHLGSQITDPESYREAIEAVLEAASQERVAPLEFSPGGGWGVRYTEDDPPDDPELWIRAVCEAVRENCARRRWRLPRLVIEPGRWLAARAGVAIYTAGSQKETATGEWIVAVDGGMADNPRPALYGSRYTVRSVEKPLAGHDRTARLVGRYCESGDYLIREARLPSLQRGDHLAIPVSGAYQLSMASNYNLTPRPAVLWLADGRVEVLQEREHLDSWWGD